MRMIGQIAAFLVVAALAFAPSPAAAQEDPNAGRGTGTNTRPPPAGDISRRAGQVPVALRPAPMLCFELYGRRSSCRLTKLGPVGSPCTCGGGKFPSPGRVEYR